MLRVEYEKNWLGVDKVYNADQTAVFHEYVPKKTITKEGEKTVWVKCAGREKERVTVILLADESGLKHKPFIVMRTTKSRTPQTVKENITLRHGFGQTVWEEVMPLQERYYCQIYANPTAS